jgi:hypothetical protein
MHWFYKGALPLFVLGCVKAVSESLYSGIVLGVLLTLLL